MMKMDSPAIVVHDLRVIRGGRPVIPGLTLQVPRGQVVGLLGPSGCGKTTLMRCIVGVQKISSGTVEVLDLPAGSKPLRDRVGYLTQTPSVYPDLTIAENLHYFAVVLGVPRRRLGEEARVLERRLSERRAAGVRCPAASRVLAAALLGTPGCSCSTSRRSGWTRAPPRPV
jgi:ABC-2 type transport system ATP-binding protein